MPCAAPPTTPGPQMHRCPRSTEPLQEGADVQMTKAGTQEHGRNQVGRSTRENLVPGILEGASRTTEDRAERTDSDHLRHLRPTLHTGQVSSGLASGRSG